MKAGKGNREQTLAHGVMAKKDVQTAILFSFVFSIPATHKISVFDLCGYISTYPRDDNPSYPSFQQLHRKLSQVLISAKFIAWYVYVCTYIHIHICVYTHAHIYTCIWLMTSHSLSRGHIVSCPTWLTGHLWRDRCIHWEQDCAFETSLILSKAMHMAYGDFVVDFFPYILLRDACVSINQW